MTGDTSPPAARYRIEALAKGLQVLRLFDHADSSLRTTDIAQRTGVPLATTFRVVATLEEFGFLERLPDGSVRPGLSVISLGSAALRSSSLLEASDRPLRNLADVTGETVNLGVLTSDRVLYVARLRNSDLVTANVQVGSTLPAVYTSMGKLLLAHLPVLELEQRISPSSFPANAGPNALLDLVELKAALAQIRSDGFAVQDQELALGLRSISVAVFSSDSFPIAALNVAVSASRYDLPTMVGAFLEPLQSAANEITMRVHNA